MVLSGVGVKWQKEVFKSVEIDTSQPSYVFKCQLYDLTEVPPERQKIMVKGGLLKGDADWSTVGVKHVKTLDSIYWFLPSSLAVHDEIVKAPEKGPVFMEDLPEEEQVISLGHSAGLFNLGNTCYMNSTVQCLHSVPELKSALFKYSHSGRSNDLDQTSHMLTVLLIKHPQFSQSHNGVFMQQDTEECWTQLLYTLSQSLRSPGSSANVDTVKDLFGIELASSHSRNTDKKKPSKVDYPLELDVYDLCSDELRKLLEGPRQLLRDDEGKKLGLKANEKSSGSKDGDAKMTDAEGSSNAGGESSATTSQEGKWIEFDDDKPIPQQEEDIVKLSGGDDSRRA
ncbi:hypothetical protein GOBAR_DD18324 [Gossypium barbadense]|nr:hypothetical protein GOBAR_DD18324 [Gossypium barbadense]